MNGRKLSLELTRSEDNGVLAQVDRKDAKAKFAKVMISKKKRKK